MITSLLLERKGAHSHVTVRFNGKTIGTLTVGRGEEHALLNELIGGRQIESVNITEEAPDAG